MTTDELTWAAPDGGHWQWAGSHVPHAPTPIYAAIHIHALPTGVAKVYERYGVPLATNPEVLINGRIFMSTQPLVGKPGSPPPPAPILWLASRLHPVLRRRARTAARAVEDRIWRERTEAWHAEIRPNLRRTNLLLQAEDPGSFDGEQLADHLRRLHQHVVDSHVLHFELHGDDMGPLGLFLAVCRDWGIDPGDAIAALTGHSPSTTAAVEALRKVAVAVDATGRRAPADRPTTLDGLRRLGPGVAAALDEYLEEFGWRVVTGYDLDARTVAEMPEVLLANVWSLPAAGTDRHVERAGETAAAALRERVPVADRGRFDDALQEARLALDLRDDNGPMTCAWTIGLLRRAVLEIGRRAMADGRLREVDHVLELSVDETVALAAGQTGPGAVEAAARADERARLSSLVPPASIGPASVPPPLHLFPKAVATVTDMALTCIELLEKTRATTPSPQHVGLGVGAQRYRGRARVARTPEEALAALEPGEVLIVPFTTPAYNTVLSIAGGLVTEEGGALSHAAVLARELELPAVIGVAGVLTAIPDGAQVTVDPTIGEVTVG